MTILAFLQNPWHPQNTSKRVIEKYRDNQKFHRVVFRNSMSGRRLLKALGPEFFDRVIWDNACELYTSRSDGLQKYSRNHMLESIRENRPDLVLAFGNQARMGMEEMIFMRKYSGLVLYCHHPNARGRTQADLNNFAITVREAVHNHGTSSETMGARAPNASDRAAGR